MLHETEFPGYFIMLSICKTNVKTMLITVQEAIYQLNHMKLEKNYLWISRFEHFCPRDIFIL